MFIDCPPRTLGFTQGRPKPTPSVVRYLRIQRHEGVHQAI